MTCLTDARARKWLRPLFPERFRGIVGGEATVRVRDNDSGKVGVPDVP